MCLNNSQPLMCLDQRSICMCGTSCLQNQVLCFFSFLLGSTRLTNLSITMEKLPRHAPDDFTLDTRYLHQGLFLIALNTQLLKMPPMNLVLLARLVLSIQIYWQNAVGLCLQDVRVIQASVEYIMTAGGKVNIALVQDSDAYSCPLKGRANFLSVSPLPLLGWEPLNLQNPVGG